MRNSGLKVLLIAAVILALQLSAFAQTIGYTITDDGDGATLPQRLYGFNINTGAIVSPYPRDIGPVADNGNEYGGLASIGSVLYAVSTNYDFPNENDLVFCGPRRVPTCHRIDVTDITFGTKTGAAYNRQDGYIYVLASDYLIETGTTQTRLYRLSPTDAKSVDFAPGVSFRSVSGVGTGADTTPYLDGLAINNSGLFLATESRIGSDGINDATSQGGLYALNAANGQARYCGDLFTTNIRRDTGASFVGTSTQLTVLLEDGRLYNVNSANCTASTATVINDRATLRTVISAAAGDSDFKGLDIPVLTIR